ncbi:amino acid adenylation domain-containing protein [Streptomyces californicus]|uniref:amino acid adenylation domain-containing protein n=1 Tax=Streptomyces californicus TaxID=67351 RepID=UPI0036DD821E
MEPDEGWNDTRRPYPDGWSVHGIVAGIARDRPGAVALIDGGERTTYAELDRSADAYARALADHGVGRGEVVAILLPRGTELVVTVLAVLKAGAAYALLEPDWPKARLRDVVAELGAEVAVCDSARADGLGLRVWTPPGLRAAPRAEGFTPVRAGGADPCCVFVTSGTTGRPKAVLSPHRATVRLFRPGLSFGDFTPHTVKPLAAPLPWDGFTLELWSALLVGGTSVIVREPYLTPFALRRAVRDHGVNDVFLSSGLFNLFVDEDIESFAGVSQVMTGGDRLSVPHVRAFLDRFPGTALINGYGPVESTVVAATRRIVRADCEVATGVPIGRPAPDTRVHVLDGARPCAIGEAGELCVAGDGLALGYLGDPAATAERFPVLELDGAETRVYRTGDLARWDENGVLHFLGRMDRQVKVRGYRIEPAEVERQTEQVLPVRRCVAVPRRAADGGYRGLVAFCVPERAGDPLDGALAGLREVLAPYHVPESVIAVAEIPRTARGKVDETALLALLDDVEAAPPADGRAPAAPAEDSGDDLDLLVGRVAADVLGRDTVPPGEDFVALGGTSLDAGRVCARLTSELGRPVPVSLLLRERSVRGLAAALRETPAPSSGAAREGGPVPLTPVQRDFLGKHLSAPDDRQTHCTGVWLVDGPVDIAALDRAAAYVHRRHEALRAAYRDDPEPGAVPGNAPAPRTVRLPAAASEEEAVREVHRELLRPLEITEGENWRLAALPVDGGATAVGYVVHHIAFDGWSETVLARDLAEGYRGGAERSAASSLARTRAAWEAHRAALPPAEPLLRELVEELRDTPELPLRPGPSAGRGAPSRVVRTLSEKGVAALREEAVRSGCTLFTVLLAGYARAVARVTGQDDFGVVVPVAQRLDAGMEDVIGCHVNMVCIRVRGAGGVSPEGAAPLVRRALAAQHVGFDVLIARLREAMPPRTPGVPLFQTNFVVQGEHAPVLDLGPVRGRPVRPPYAGLTTPLQTEVWPDGEGGLRIVVNFLPSAGDLVEELADAFRGELGGRE